ncbi:hypothetical protein A0J61_02081 [Choanephora cucurbitarum]|uniref:Uncharacterized protein n=1 Tax=Choanephora cucurbitarum TaxID=101091 RepID=A0A1C7NLK0_9FUNG|nr:hypothetical protein A0J61_02081 [Choanephora cucurbitarum]
MTAFKAFPPLNTALRRFAIKRGLLLFHIIVYNFFRIPGMIFSIWQQLPTKITKLHLSTCLGLEREDSPEKKEHLRQFRRKSTIRSIKDRFSRLDSGHVISTRKHFLEQFVSDNVETFYNSKTDELLNS